MEFHGATRRVPQLCVGRRKPKGIHHPGDHPWRALRAAVRRRDRLRWPARRAYRFRFYPHFRALHQHSSRLRPFHNPGKQYCPDHWLGRRIARRGRHVHHPCADLSRFRLRIHVLADFPIGFARWVARRALHGAAAPPTDRQRTRKPGVSRRHRMRRRACRRGTRRLLRGPRFLGTRCGRCLHLPDEHGASVDLTARRPA